MVDTTGKDVAASGLKKMWAMTGLQSEEPDATLHAESRSDGRWRSACRRSAASKERGTFHLGLKPEASACRRSATEVGLIRSSANGDSLVLGVSSSRSAIQPIVWNSAVLSNAWQ